MQKLMCPKCNTQITAENMDMANTTATCHNCNAVFDFSFVTEQEVTTKRKKRNIRQISKPAHFSVEAGDYDLQIAWTWFRWEAILFTFFLIIWNSFLYVWYREVFEDQNWVMGAFAIFHLGAGIALTYHTLGMYFNKTYLSISPERIRAYTTPFPPFRGNKTIPADEVSQAYVKQVVHQNKNNKTYEYRVMIITHDARSIELIRSLKRTEFGLFIEQEIENYLGIENRPVSDAHANRPS